MQSIGRVASVVREHAAFGAEMHACGGHIIGQLEIIYPKFNSFHVVCNYDVSWAEFLEKNFTKEVKIPVIHLIQEISSLLFGILYDFSPCIPFTSCTI